MLEPQVIAYRLLDKRTRPAQSRRYVELYLGFDVRLEVISQQVVVRPVSDAV